MSRSPCVWQNDVAGSLVFEAATAVDADLACPLLQFSSLSWWLGFRIGTDGLVQELPPERETSAQDTAG